jgi:tripartite ATP-independent transporter DctM subunit
MSGISIGIICIGIFFFLLFSGIPIAFSLGTSGFIGLWWIMGFNKAVNMCATLSYSTVSNFTFAVIPLFILMGMLVTHTGMSKNIYDTFSMWFNRVPAGMGVATVWSCAAFGTLNGSAGVTSSVFARASGPELVARGYDEEITYGMIAAAGSIGQFIPPSILIIIYGVLSGDSIGRLLMAGVSPGISLGIIFSLVLIIIATVRPDLIPKSTERYSWKHKILHLKNLIPVTLVGGIIVWGLLSGSYSSTEAGAVGATIFVLYSFYKKVPLNNVKLAFLETAKISCMTFSILICASFFSKLMTLSRLSAAISSMVESMEVSPSAYLVVVVLIYLVMGCFLDSNSCLCVSLPIFLPVCDVLGIDRIHFAMVVILALHVGGITPPVGMGVFFVKSVIDESVSLQGIFKGALPFLAAMVVLIVIYILNPTLSTFLPNLVFG